MANQEEKIRRFFKDWKSIYEIFLNLLSFFKKIDS